MPGQAATPEVSGSALLRRSFRKSFPPAVHGEGAYLWDARGKQYLDFSGSGAVNFIGHGVSEIVAAMTMQARSLEFVDGSQFTTPVAEKYAQELLSFAGENFLGGAVYFCSGGPEAIETAAKLARQYQREMGRIRRTEILNGVLDREYTDSIQQTAELQQAIADQRDSLAAVILEPFGGPSLFLTHDHAEKVAELCRESDIPLIANEVMTGVGRTGRNFGVDHSGIAPDILAISNGLSSGYAPLGAIIISQKVVDAISFGSGSFIHGFSYSSHPISLAAGRAVLNYVLKQDLVPAADSDHEGMIARQLKHHVQGLRNLPCVKDVRGIGLLWSIEFVCEPSAKTGSSSASSFSGKVAQSSIERGLLVYPLFEDCDGLARDRILVAPPAVISSYQVSWACEQLAEAIEQASAHA